MTKPTQSGQPLARAGDYEIRFKPCRKRIRVEFNGTCIADAVRAIILHETRMPPTHYFPAADVRMDYLDRTQHQTHWPFKGNATDWTLKVADKVAEDAAWAHEESYRGAEPIRWNLSFYRNEITALQEGDEEIAGDDALAFLRRRGVLATFKEPSHRAVAGMPPAGTQRSSVSK